MEATADSYRLAGPEWSREPRGAFTDLSVSIRSRPLVRIITGVTNMYSNKAKFREK